MRVAVIAVGAVMAIGIGWITLGPQPIGHDGWLAFTRSFFRSEDGFDSAAFYGAEFTANLVLFVPIGLTLVRVLGTRRWWLALVLALVLTATIESAQESLPGRVSDLRDILANAIGAAAGVTAGVLWDRWRIGRDRRAHAKAPRAAAPAA